jgi:dephospho-CoA kinase
VSTDRSRTRNRPRRIGVTGGIGSGKTTVCREFEKLGRKVLYADPLARDLMESDQALRGAIAREFGREAYNIDGTLNRPYLADRIFSEDKNRKRMNAIVHPFVFQALDRIIETEFGGQTEPYILIEAALIYESGLDKRLDAVLLVDAPLDIRADRVARRDGLSAEEIRRRFESQQSAQILRKKADFVLDNIGDIVRIRPKVRFLDRVFQQI